MDDRKIEKQVLSKWMATKRISIISVWIFTIFEKKKSILVLHDVKLFLERTNSRLSKQMASRF